MQRWEYKVVSLRDGRYTSTLNEYGRDGWELVSVVPDDDVVPTPEKGRAIPMPRALGRLEDAATKLSNLGGADSPDSSSEPSSTLLWVLRRPLDDN